MKINLNNLKKAQRKVELSGRLIFIILIYCCSSIQYSNAREKQEAPPAQVGVVEAKERMLAPIIQATGSVKSLHRSQISAQVSGELIWIAIVGSSVTKGDVIGKIDSTLLKANLQIAKSQLEKLKADLHFRNQEVSRFKRLASSDNSSKARLQEETARRNMIIQDINGAKANLIKVTFDFEQSQIKAPFSGYVVKRMVSKGEYLTKGDQVLQLVDTIHKEVKLNAPLSLLAVLKKGMSIEVSNQTKKDEFPISAIVPVGDDHSRMIEIRLEITNNNWIVGESVNIRLPAVIPQKRVVIPRDSLIKRGSKTFIYRVNSKMIAEQIMVDIDLVDGYWIAIKQPIETGDHIIFAGGERLRPGQKVSITVAEPRSNQSN